ncbi:lon protease [Actinobacillus equuli]|nr:lon protease [Actinobacillus equuli]
MNLTPLDWQSLTLHHSFQETSNEVGFFDFQPNAKQAIDQFKRGQFGSLLVIKTETFPEFIQEIKHYLAENLTSPLVTKTEFSRNHLFGYSIYLEKEHKVENVTGAIQQANNGILLLNVNSLLLDITQWDKLKQALLFGSFEQNAVNNIPYLLPPIQSNFKLVLIGSREDISLLAEYDDSLYQVAQYTEVESYLTLNDEILSNGVIMFNQAPKNGLTNRLLTKR